MRRVAGFTIIELMIVLAIAGTVASLSVPAFREWIDNSRRTATLNDLVGTLSAARSEAVKRNKRVAGCPTDDPADPAAKCSGASDWKKGWILFVDDDTDFDRGAAEQLLASHDALPGGGRSLVGTVDAFAYRSNGRLETDGDVSADDASFLLCDSRGDDQGRFVDVPLSGRPEISQTDLNGDAPGACP